ncbi:MAG: hypothetical protein HUU55_01425 [Myxococcales bacterium]|nr:hypothetical protein [Myxococcales bacterium]
MLKVLPKPANFGLVCLIAVAVWIGALSACKSRTITPPNRDVCISSDDCAPGQTCVQGACMTDAAERARQIPRARRAAEEFERAQETIEENRDRAIKAIDEQR